MDVTGVSFDIVSIYQLFKSYLTYSFPRHPFSTSWKQKTLKVFWCSRGVGKGCIGNEWVQSWYLIHVSCNSSKRFGRLFVEVFSFQLYIMILSNFQFKFFWRLPLRYIKLREKCPNTDLFWSVFSCIWTE